MFACEECEKIFNFYKDAEECEQEHIKKQTSRYLTIGALKKILEPLPEDMTVWISETYSDAAKPVFKTSQEPTMMINDIGDHASVIILEGYEEKDSYTKNSKNYIEELLKSES